MRFTMCRLEVVQCFLFILVVVQESGLTEHVAFQRPLSREPRQFGENALSLVASAASVVSAAAAPSLSTAERSSASGRHLQPSPAPTTGSLSHQLEPSTPFRREFTKDLPGTPHLVASGGHFTRITAAPLPASILSSEIWRTRSPLADDRTLPLQPHSQFPETLEHSEISFHSDRATVAIETSSLLSISSGIFAGDGSSDGVASATARRILPHHLSRLSDAHLRELLSLDGETGGRAFSSHTLRTESEAISAARLEHSTTLSDRILWSHTEGEITATQTALIKGSQERRLDSVIPGTSLGSPRQTRSLISPTPSILPTASQAAQPGRSYRLPTFSAGDQPLHATESLPGNFHSSSQSETFEDAEGVDGSPVKLSTAWQPTSAVVVETPSPSTYGAIKNESNDLSESAVFSSTRSLHPTSPAAGTSNDTLITTTTPQQKPSRPATMAQNETHALLPQNDTASVTSVTSLLSKETHATQGLESTTTKTEVSTVLFSGLDFRDMVVIYIVSALVGCCFCIALALRICNRIKKSRKKKSIEKRNQQRESAKKRNVGSMKRTTELIAKETSRAIPKVVSSDESPNPSKRNLTLEALIEIGALTKASLGVNYRPENEVDSGARALLVREQAIYDENAYENPAFRYRSDEEVYGTAVIEVESSDNESVVGLTTIKGRKRPRLMKPQLVKCSGKRTDSRDSGYIENFASSDSLRMKALARAISSEERRRKSVQRVSGLTTVPNDEEDDFMNEISSCPCNCQETPTKSVLRRSRSSSLPNIDIYGGTKVRWQKNKDLTYTMDAANDDRGKTYHRAGVLYVTESESSDGVSTDTETESGDEFALPPCNFSDFPSLDEEQTPPPSPLRQNCSDDESSIMYDIKCMRLAIKRYSQELERPPTPLRRSHAIDIAESDNWRRDSIKDHSQNFIPLEGIQLDFLGPVYLMDLQDSENETSINTGRGNGIVKNEPAVTNSGVSDVTHLGDRTGGHVRFNEHTVVKIADV